ncbi:hypothetical protein D9M71_701240 [compost metagenome]
MNVFVNIFWLLDGLSVNVIFPNFELEAFTVTAQLIISLAGTGVAVFLINSFARLLIFAVAL